ncbi:MAG TPA: hypothetical protein VFA68_06410 [Terriglobales bacterium]|nr:hypothetical protein [Terriglobales bacterium]
MTIDPSSGSTVRESVLQLARTKLQGAHEDVKSRNGHIQAMKDDIKAGNLEAAQQEREAALAAEQKVLADRSALLDFHKSVGGIRADIAQRGQDFLTFRTDMQAGDIEGAKAAFRAFHQDQREIVKDLQALGLNPSPSPFSVTA